MESTKITPKLLQFTVIVLMSVSASYAFQHTETVYQINGVCFYRYLAYASTVLLGYLCFSHYKKYVALAFSLSLSLAAFSPIGQKVIELFPSAVPFLAVLMGVIAIFVAPKSRGRGFFEFLLVLVLPAILAESRIGGSSHLIATIESVGYFELAAITVIIVGGYFYLRYAVLSNLSCIELASNGANEKDVAEVCKQSNIVSILIVAGASGIAAFLMITVSIFSGVLRATVAVLPAYVLALAMGAGISVMVILYIFKYSNQETTRIGGR